MSPHTFTTSPGAEGQQRKFINPTGGYVGANVFGADGKPTAIAVEPGGEVWLTPAEERMTAEAPRSAADNPFVKQWEEVVEWDPTGAPARTVLREGLLVLSHEPPRPTASDRYVPERASAEEPPPAPPAPEREETVTGAPPAPEQPPVQGQPSPGEVVGTPDAVPANREAVARRKPTAEQPVVPVA